MEYKNNFNKYRLEIWKTNSKTLHRSNIKRNVFRQLFTSESHTTAKEKCLERAVHPEAPEKPPEHTDRQCHLCSSPRGTEASVLMRPSPTSPAPHKAAEAAVKVCKGDLCMSLHPHSLFSLLKEVVFNLISWLWELHLISYHGFSFWLGAF